MNIVLGFSSIRPTYMGKYGHLIISVIGEKIGMMVFMMIWTNFNLKIIYYVYEGKLFYFGSLLN
jgi:hypothetical protein